MLPIESPTFTCDRTLRYVVTSTIQSPDQQDMSERFFNKTEFDENAPEFGFDSSSLVPKRFVIVTSTLTTIITLVGVLLPGKSNEQKV